MLTPERLRKVAASATVDACTRVGREAVQALLARYGAKKASELGDYQLETFIDAADELKPLPPSDDHLIGRAYCETDVRYGMPLDERGKAIRDKLNECGLAIVRVEKRAPAQDPPPVPLYGVAFGTVVQRVDDGLEYLVGNATNGTGQTRVLVALSTGSIKFVPQDTRVQFVRSHV